MIGIAQSEPLLVVRDLVVGDYYIEVPVQMSQDGIVYVYPLPTEVQIAPDDSSIISYGFSGNVTAGVQKSIFVEELQSRSSYNLYITGRSTAGVVSSPARIVRAATTTARSSLHINLIASHCSHPNHS